MMVESVDIAIMTGMKNVRKCGVAVITALAVLALAAGDERRPTPSAALKKRIAAGFERYGIVHFSINTFTDREWGYGNESPEPKPPRPAFENVGIPTVHTKSSQTFMFKGQRSFSVVTIIPDKANVAGAPILFRLSFSDDGERWRTDGMEYRLDNVGANPIPQRLSLSREEKARYVRIDAVRMLKDDASLANLGLTLGR